ncbi:MULTISPECIES: ribonuclease H-like domain-containing protein [Bacillati]|uniref:DNA-directed RNA polymerase subunit RPC12/RpoP n=1 Tax=Arthrobacter russicus TaxID=172040 RepID=A0ABU1J9S5_9MICC|nr:ribonuclease H-like domain-containing protein [Arthrobacter russicus]MDR6268904.1 DNA-directed RNA polymerase subunit RPC12/RpoP [Arthrobacter russicus]
MSGMRVLPRIPKLSPAAKNLRILVFDIETAPHLVHAWGLFKQNVSLNQIIEPGKVFAFAYKWVGTGRTMFASEQSHGHEGMVQLAWDLFDEADIVIGYNSAPFDIPHMQREFLLAGLTPPKPFKQIDLLKTIRKQFNFASGKLDWVAQSLGIGHKTHHEGHMLWRRCLDGDPKAWAKMGTYAKQDVALTEKLYHYLLPWLTNAPHLGQMSRDEHSCPYCGGKRLRRDGTTHAFVTSYRLYECLNCHAWIRGTKKLQDATTTRPATIN